VIVDGKPSGKVVEAYSWDGRWFCSDPKVALDLKRRQKQLQTAAKFTERERRLLDSLD